MNVLLIYPEFPDTFWSLRHALRFVGKKAVYPPLGLLTVAAMLPPAWGKRLVDLNVTRLTAKDLAWADCAFVSAMILQTDSARHVIRRCKEHSLTIVAGGPLFSSGHETFEQVDHFILNEAEPILPSFLSDLEQGRARRFYTATDFADMQTSPVPLWQLASLNRYHSACIQFSRGCPYDCEFCNVTTLFGHRPRAKTARQVLCELNALYAVGWRGAVFFVDDNFIGNRSNIKTVLLPALIEWRNAHPGVTFHTQLSIDLADDEELMDLMVKAGFDMVFIGIETPDEGCLRECGKKQNRNRNLLEDVKRIQRAGLQVQGGFIVGFDSDAPSIFQRQIEFIQRSGIVTAMVGLLQALPGTKLYSRLRKEGRLFHRTSGDNVDGTTNVVPVMDMDTLRKGYRKVLQHIYSPKNYYQRVRTFLREFGQHKRRPSLLPQDFLAFFRSAYRLGILGKERIHYWKLLLWTGLRRPRLLSLAIELAICGHHFRITSERHVR